MNPNAQRLAERRVLILAPTGRDAVLTRDVLGEAGVRSAICQDLAELVVQLEVGAGALLISEEALANESHLHYLGERLSIQEPWSDLPVLLLTHPGADSPMVRMAVRHLGNVTLIERPVRVASMMTATQSALRARERQFHAREHLQELRESDRRKDEFLAVLAHELRNPLAPIRNSLHILRMGGSDDAGTGRVVDMMERQVQHMVRLVDDLLEVSRISRGKIELRKERLALGPVLVGAVETSRPLLESANHTLVVEIPEEELHVEADAVRLQQVFANLLNNAAKYTAPGGEIRLTARAANGVAEVCVKDNGEGIPPQMLGRVFNMFTQVNTGNRAQGGLGIGLTLARTLVHLHGGSIEAASEGPGRGCEFLVKLPIVSAHAGAVAEQAQAPGPGASLAGSRVLVVDDNHDAADSLGMLLQVLGADVMVVHDGPAALAAMEAFAPAVVLLDLGMPEMDGLEVARRMRADPQMRSATLVALTGWGQREDRRRTGEAGFDYHLVKPADMGTLEAILSKSHPGSGVTRH